MHLEDFENKKPKKLEAFDSWLLIKLNKIIKQSTEGFDEYEFSKAKKATEKFFSIRKRA